MIRTQIYLTTDEQNKLRGIAAETGKPQSELIRDAIDLYVVRYVPESRKGALRKAKGIWKNRKDISATAKLRKEFDRD